MFHHMYKIIPISISKQKWERDQTQGIKQVFLSNSVYPTSRRHRPSGGAGGAVARRHAASISFIKESSSAPAAASLIAVATRTRTIWNAQEIMTII